jgi:hypothetical protein
MMSRMISCAEANKMDLVDYLNSLGFLPRKISGSDYWYLSPFREENTPSFKVNRRLNVWYDHGIGIGGNLVDFGLQYYHCSIVEFLKKVDEKNTPIVSFQLHNYTIQKPENAGEKKIFVIAANPLKSPTLCIYLRNRKIDLTTANQHLKEVLFELNGREYKAIGFRNRSGGYELRNECFKGSSSPKDVTIFNNESENISVFEGFFSFLSYLTLAQRTSGKTIFKLSQGQTNCLILNSLSYFEKSRNLMEKHTSINLFLDRDTAGIQATQQALTWSKKYKDNSVLYAHHKDFNDYLIFVEKLNHKRNLSRGRSM